MQIQRLRAIVEYSEKNRGVIAGNLKRFYSYAETGSDNELLNVMQIARDVLKKNGYLVIELPLADSEIGAVCCKGDALDYIIINTSVPEVNMNFAVCHELYHVFFDQDGFRSKVEFTDDYYEANEAEMAANLFAGMLLLPETGFRNMFNKFMQDSEGNVIHTIINLMSYYQAPYTAVLIRCSELKLLKDGCVTEELLSMSEDKIREYFFELWLDDRILNCTENDNYGNLRGLVKHIGGACVADEYINQRTLDKVLKNMEQLYSEIRNVKGSDL